MKKLLPILLFAFSACAPARLLTLKDSLKTGDRLVFRQTDDVETEVDDAEYAGLSVRKEQIITDFAFEVQFKHPDGSTDLEMTILRMQKTSSEKGITRSFDSDTPDSTNLEHQILMQSVGAPFRITLAPNGATTAFSGMEAVWSEIEKIMSAQPSLQGMIGSVKKQFSDESMSENYSGIWDIYPDSPVRRGQKWSRTYFRPSFGLDAKSTYTLQSADANQAVLSSSSVFTANPEKPGVMDMGMFKIIHRLSGASTGAIVLDQPQTMLKNMKQTTLLEGNMEVIITGLPSRTIPVKIKSEQTIERLQ